jgi:Mrp family chromosome partitioning ATPase
MQEFLQQAGENYDQIIIDGPPVLLLSDSLVMTSMVSGVILVCRAKASLRGAVQRAREQLERVNGRVLGAVLNAAQVSRGGYFREQMRSYYDYQPAEVAAAESARTLPIEQQHLGYDQHDDDGEEDNNDNKG